MFDAEDGLMRMCGRRWLALALVPLLVGGLSACGGSGGAGPTGTIAKGADVLGLPFLPSGSGESLEIGLRNLSEDDATVWLSARSPFGVPYLPAATMAVVPGQGEVRFPLTTFTGAAVPVGGWIEVDTRDITVLDPVTGTPTPTTTSGFVVPYVRRSMSGVETDAAPGIAFRPDFVSLTLAPETQSYQLINRSYVPLAGGAALTGADYDVTVYDPDGTVSTTFSAFVPAQGADLLLPTLPAGRVEVVPTPPPAQTAPAATVFDFAITGFEADPQVMIEARFLTVDRSFQRDVGFGVDFGYDAGGNVHDFTVQLTNTSTEDVSVVLDAVRRSNGTQLLAAPRIITLGGKRTKLLATTTRDSLGLELGEDSPFDDLFGDVATKLGTYEQVLVDLTAPAAVDVSARHTDTLFKSYYRIVPGNKLTTDVMVPGVAVPSTTAGGIRNFVALMNPGSSARAVNVFGYTPGGTQYDLGMVDVPAFSRVDWSPDGREFREDPTDIAGPPVPFMGFRLTGDGGLYFNAWRTRRDISDLIISITPHIVHDLRDE